jgi:hypothetical protein
MKIFQITLLCAAAVGLAAPVLADDAMKMSGDKTYDFAAQNGSGETGTVSLKAAGADATLVTVSLKGAPAEAQPAHIHKGSCAKLDPKPLYPLSNVVNGMSTTTVKEPISKLTGGGLAVNVHKSTADIATYVACADLGGSMMMKGDSMKMSPAASPSP